MAATLCLSVDNLGAALAIDRGRAVRPDPDEPGLAVGLPRALSMFEEIGLTATFFLEGWNGLHHPDAVQRILGAGHEVGLHGWVHERWAELTDDRQETLLWDGTAALRSAGADPQGFRAPGGYRGARTAAVLADLDYAYDSSIEDQSDQDYLRVHELPGGLTVVPWHWRHNDYWQYYMNPAGHQSSEQVLNSWLGDLEEVAGADTLLTLTLHPFVSFVDDDKANTVRRLLESALARPDVNVLSAGRVAAAGTAHPTNERNHQ